MATGHVEQLPSGSWRAKVYAGRDPLSGREIRLRTTCKTEQGARAALRKLLEQASIGRPPQTAATLGFLLDQYMPVIGVETSTKLSYAGYIRRTLKPALGDLPLRNIRGP
jgi:integrase